MTTPTLSFELFPPRSLPASFQLWQAVDRLRPLDARFYSVTFGAGGGADPAHETRTLETVKAIQSQTGAPVAAHLTCAGASRDETLARATALADAGVGDIVALRGDATGGASFTPHPDGFRDSVDLVRTLAGLGRFNIRVGAYPDPHPDATSTAQNIDWLKRKFDAGASEAITQFFFEADTFLRFRDACVAAGITQPIIPGILPITDWGKTTRFAKRCGIAIPERLADGFERAGRDGRHDLLALTQCTTLCTRLINEGVGDLHFYTLNRADLSREICAALGCSATSRLRNVA